MSPCFGDTFLSLPLLTKNDEPPEEVAQAINNLRRDIHTTTWVLTGSPTGSPLAKRGRYSCSSSSPRGVRRARGTRGRRTIHAGWIREIPLCGPIATSCGCHRSEFLPRSRILTKGGEDFVNPIQQHPGRRRDLDTDEPSVGSEINQQPLVAILGSGASPGFLGR